MIRPLLIACFVCLTPAVHAQIYSYIDENGNRVYTDQKPLSEKGSAQKPIATDGAVNFYSPPKRETAIKKNNAPETPDTQLNASSNDIANTDSEGSGEGNMTEQQCQEQYQLSCDRVVNWRRYALEKCGKKDPRCQDEEYLDAKYRPRTIEEMQTVARLAGQRNRRDKEIAQFLLKEYTRYCSNQAEMYCKNKRSKQCKKAMEGFCSDSRDLNDVFNQYSNLSLAEKRKIIAKAQQLSTTSGKDQKAYQKVMADLLKLMVTKATLGI